MRERQTVCPARGDDAARQDGRDRQGARAYRRGARRRRFTALSATPCCGYRFPPEVIALGVRWYLRYRLSYADVAELLAERDVAVDPSTVDAWVRAFAPLDEDAARAFRRMVGSRWSVDETYVRVAGAWRYVYRASMDQPVISILTPTRDRAASFLPLAVASVAALRLSCPYEHVIVDDASTDGTPGYLAAVAARDPRVRLVLHEAPRGVAAARNSAARAARGQFLVDLDDDDLLLADGVERRYRYLLAHPAYWAVHANAPKIDEAGRYLIGEESANFLCADPRACARHFYESTMIPNASTAMYRREALLALGGWDEALSCCEDYDLWLRSVERYGPPGFLEAPVALWRKKGRSLGIDSIRSGAHERNQARLKARWAHLVR